MFSLFFPYFVTMFPFFVVPNTCELLVRVFVGVALLLGLAKQDLAPTPLTWVSAKSALGSAKHAWAKTCLTCTAKGVVLVTTPRI